MAMSQQRGARGPRIKSFGRFTLSDDGRGHGRLHLTGDLQVEDFTAEPGDEVKVELVIPDDGHSYLEVHPVNPPEE